MVGLWISFISNICY